MGGGRIIWGAGLAACLLALLALGSESRGPPSHLVVWAWERPENLLFLNGDAEVAVQTGFVMLSGDRVFARGRHDPLLAEPSRVTTSLVHVEIDRLQPLAWTPEMRRGTVQAVLSYAAAVPAERVQVDFEVRQSERQVLLDVLHDVRAALPAKTLLSMTAIASWCDTESWLDAAPVDEIVPMLFRMGPRGETLKARLASGGDFRNRRCRSALAVSTDAPLKTAPAGRRVYMFSPRGWSQADYERLAGEVGGWSVNR